VRCVCLLGAGLDPVHYMLQICCKYDPNMRSELVVLFGLGVFLPVPAYGRGVDDVDYSVDVTVYLGVVV
jgi:hypothetical protein